MERNTLIIVSFIPRMAVSLTAEEYPPLRLEKMFAE